MATTNRQISARARMLYAALPEARFTKATVLALARCLDDKAAWTEIPAEVKVCIMKLAMALSPPDEEEAAPPAPAPSPPYEAPTATPIANANDLVAAVEPIKPDAILSPGAAQAETVE